MVTLLAVVFTVQLDSLQFQRYVGSIKTLLHSEVHHLGIMNLIGEHCVKNQNHNTI